MKKPSKTSTLKPKHLEVLDGTREDLLRSLSFTRKDKLYLAGGTALAFYLNHRTSRDFDFYSPKEFPEKKLVKTFLDKFSKHQLEVLRDKGNTFHLSIGGISLSCFYYPYGLIRELTEFAGVYVASLEDIAAMKVVAIVQRGTYRDFIDIYYLLEIFGLSKILSWALEKYPSYSKLMVLKGLIYFEDAEKNIKLEKKRIRIFDRSLIWKKVKKYITDEVIKYQKSFFKG